MLRTKNWLGWNNINFSKALASIKENIRKVEQYKSGKEHINSLLKSLSQRLKTIARVISEANDKVEIEKNLLKKLMEMKIINEKLNQEVNQKLSKKKVIDELHNLPMNQEIAFSKIFIKHLVQWEVKYNELSQDTPIVFELFPVDTIARDKEQVLSYNLFKIKLSFTSKGKVTDIIMIKELQDFFPTELVPTYTSTDGLNLDPIESERLFCSCFNFIWGKIDAIVSQIEDKIHWKTLINICSSQLYGFKRLIEDLRDIYSSKILQVYVSSIAVWSTILEKQEYYDADETLLFCKIAVIETQNWYVEVLLNVEWDQKFIFKIISYTVNGIKSDEENINQNFRPITDQLDQILFIPDSGRVGKPYMNSLSGHISQIQKILS